MLVGYSAVIDKTFFILFLKYVNSRKKSNNFVNKSLIIEYFFACPATLQYNFTVYFSCCFLKILTEAI